jgi:hypothetical protein
MKGLRAGTGGWEWGGGKSHRELMKKEGLRKVACLFYCYKSGTLSLDDEKFLEMDCDDGCIIM